MKLYGVAFAVLPKKNAPDVFQVTCTPIVMDQADRGHFHILHDLKYQVDLDSMDAASSMDAFTKMVDTVGALVRLQEKSCKAAHVDYVPIALKIGQHSHHKVKINALYSLLFGEAVPFRFNWLNEDEQRVTAEDIRTRRSLRNAYVAEHALSHTFKEACRKLPELLDKCVFQLGNYAPAKNPDDPELLKPNALDEELKKLKPLFEQGDIVARQRLLELAAETGKELGEMGQFMPLLTMPAPRNYAADPQLQELLPRFSFFHWDPALTEALQNAHANVHWKNGYSSIKLPLDPQNPFFTDPLADMIRTQFQIVEATRLPEQVFHHNELLKHAISPVVSVGSQSISGRG